MLKVSEHIFLREIEVGDSKEVFELIDRERKHLRVWLPFIDYTIIERDTLNFIESVKRDSSSPVYVIIDTGKVIGLIGLNKSDVLNRKTEIGYWMSEHKQGQGIMTACVNVFLNHIFNELYYNRVRIGVATGNDRSKRIPLRLGFTLEGIERNGELLHGKYHDIEIYSLLKNEFIYSEM